MDRLIFTAASGLSESMMQQRVLASNMANAQTVGFRAEMMSSTPVTIQAPNSLEVRAMSDGEVQGADMRGGTVTQTGRALDVAVTDDTMLAVQEPDGSEVYTRRGDLSVSSSGVLQNGDGLPVIGNSGPITVPPNSTVTISADGTVLAANPDQASLPPQVVDKLKLVSTTGSKIAKDLTGLFRVVGGGALPADDNAKLTSGALEQSNVSISQGMVQMVDAQRLFDIRTKLISTAKEVDESGTSLLRMSSS